MLHIEKRLPSLILFRYILKRGPLVQWQTSSFRLCYVHWPVLAFVPFARDNTHWRNIATVLLIHKGDEGVMLLMMIMCHFKHKIP